MKIAIDISSIVYGTGVSLYTKSLVIALSNIDNRNQYILFAGTWRQKAIIQDFYDQSNLGPNFSLKILPFPPKLQTKIWNDLHIGNLEWMLLQIWSFEKK